MMVTMIPLAGCLVHSSNGVPLAQATYPTAGMPLPVLDFDGPAISPLLVGNNAWMYPDARVWNIAAQAGLRIVRIGGIGFDKNMPPKTMLSGWVDQIKAMGAEAMIQVSRFDGPEAAAEIVRYFNVETGNTVRYWNIGNEPFCNHVTDESASQVADYLKPIAAAMKAVDPSIKIFAPDECYFYEDYYASLLSGDDSPADISGKVPGKDYYYIDGISWHMYVGYPPENIPIEQLATAGAAAFLDLIQKTRALVDQANAIRGRTGEDALQWGIGEFNSSDGPRVCSFENGQMFAQVYGYIMKYSGLYGATWSMFENGGRCFGSDYSFVDAKMQPRSTYYHMQMIARDFSGTYLDGISTVEDVRIFGAVDTQAGRISVMLLNVGNTTAHDCVLRLDSSLVDEGACQVNLQVGLDVVIDQTIGSQTSMVLVFDLQGRLVRTVAYSKGLLAPQIVEYP